MTVEKLDERSSELHKIRLLVGEDWDNDFSLAGTISVESTRIECSRWPSSAPCCILKCCGGSLRLLEYVKNN